jgi:hypothetical protein
MLSRSSYSKQYVEACRAKIEAQLKAYSKLAVAARKSGLEQAVDGFEPRFFNHMVLALETYFVHRVRNQEGKDGNPLNETRLLANSLMEADGVMTLEKVIKYDPERSLLGYAPGAEIALSAEDFGCLADAFLAEIERRYP